MTERFADIAARIDGIRQLGSVVNAMKGIAAARAHGARMQVMAVDGYTATLARSLSLVLGAERQETRPDDAEPMQTGVLIFGAEQGFAGAFSERVLDSTGTGGGPLFLIGSRGLSVAASRGIKPFWTSPLPSNTPGIPKLADAITTAIYDAVARGQITRLHVVNTTWASGRPSMVQQQLFPLDLSAVPPAAGADVLTQLPEAQLIDSLGQDYFHALVTRAALHAFAAENEARMQAMTVAGSQIARELVVFEAKLRRVRQEAITAEIIELGTGATAAAPSQAG